MQLKLNIKENNSKIRKLTWPETQRYLTSYV